jgi:hypothetical protein
MCDSTCGTAATSALGAASAPERPDAVLPLEDRIIAVAFEAAARAVR